MCLRSIAVEWVYYDNGNGNGYGYGYGHSYGHDMTTASAVLERWQRQQQRFQNQMNYT